MLDRIAGNGVRMILVESQRSHVQITGILQQWEEGK
jgi:hypothetical protein